MNKLFLNSYLVPLHIFEARDRGISCYFSEIISSFTQSMKDEIELHYISIKLALKHVDIELDIAGIDHYGDL